MVTKSIKKDEKKNVKKAEIKSTKSKKQIIIISISIMFIILLIILGLTYAYYRTRVIGNTSPESTVSVLTKVLAVKYSDGKATLNMEGSIEPGFKYTKTFTVENTGDESVTYALYLDDVINEYTRTQDWEMEITCSPNCSGTNGVVNYPELSEMIVENEIASGVTQTYNVEINYLESKENQSIDMGAKLSGKFQIYSVSDTVDIEGTVADYEDGDYVQINSVEKKSQIVNGKYRLPAVEVGSHRIRLFGKTGTTKLDTNITIQKGTSANVSDTTITITDTSKTVSANISNEALVIEKIEETIKDQEYPSGTLAYEIIKNARKEINETTFSMPETTIAKQISNANEKILASTEDDEGNSYFFRGSVKDNYVEFKGMCFRIVRIEGDGSIKLIYAGNGKCSTTTSKSGSIGNEIYGSNNEKLADYKKHSTVVGIKIELETWLNNNFTNAEKTQYLKEDKWCLGGNENYKYDNLGNLIPSGGIIVKYDDVDYSTGYPQDVWDLVYIANGDEYWSWYYTAAKRLYGLGSENNATLKCSNEEDYDKNYVGILTADEVAFAGGTTKENNNTYYLYEEMQTLDWWLLSKTGVFNGGFWNYGEAFYVGTKGLSHRQVNYSAAIRPAITLLAGTSYASGDGTKTKPYVIG